MALALCMLPKNARVQAQGLSRPLAYKRVDWTDDGPVLTPAEETGLILKDYPYGAQRRKVIIIRAIHIAALQGLRKKKPLAKKEACSTQITSPMNIGIPKRLRSVSPGRRSKPAIRQMPSFTLMLRALMRQETGAQKYGVLPIFFLQVIYTLIKV